MIHPSYTELMDAINEEGNIEDEPLVTSRYSVVLATSKRARQLIAGREAMVHSSGKKPLSTAVEEIYQGKVKILPDDFQEEEETTEKLIYRDCRQMRAVLSTITDKEYA